MQSPNSTNASIYQLLFSKTAIKRIYIIISNSWIVHWVRKASNKHKILFYQINILAKTERSILFLFHHWQELSKQPLFSLKQTLYIPKILSYYQSSLKFYPKFVILARKLRRRSFALQNSILGKCIDSLRRKICQVYRSGKIFRLMSNGGILSIKKSTMVIDI